MKPASRKRVRRPLNDQAFLDKVLKEKKPRVRNPKCTFADGWGLRTNGLGYTWYQIPSNDHSWVLGPKLCRKLAKELIKCADYLDDKEGPR